MGSKLINRLHAPGKRYSDVVQGMTHAEAKLLLSAAKEQFDVWAEFTIAKRPANQVRPGFSPGWTISYVTKIEFHVAQPFEVNCYLRGYLAGWRESKQGECDQCERSPNGDSPDHTLALECGHDLCNECIGDLSKEHPIPRSEPEQTWCPLCQKIVFTNRGVADREQREKEGNSVNGAT